MNVNDSQQGRLCSPAAARAFASRAFSQSRFVKFNTWAWGAGDQYEDQGMLFWLFHVRLRGYYMPARTHNYTVVHWQTPGKPWEGDGPAWLQMQWPFYRDLPEAELEASSTPCARTLLARLRRVRALREWALAQLSANASMIAADSPRRKPTRDPVWGHLLRRPRRQRVF